ncbi:MAG: CoA transferase [Pseudorhodoplanes sp.]|nr:CoA transferase [Pseudorhodoplanes sp.]
MPQPLSGLTVLDFTTLLPGPLATLMLAEAGAEVIKVERPGGEDMRRFEPRFGDMSAPFALLNRGKRSMVIDLKDRKAVAALQPLLQGADILVEQFRPGVMERLGLGYEAVRAINPRIVYCSISGYGQSGPRAKEAGHDLNYIASAGLLALQPGPADRPVVPPALIADIGGGTFPAVINILLALRQRDRTGQGCRLDIAMTDALFTFAWHAFAAGVAAGDFPASGAAPLCGGSPRYQLYPTRDGKLVACGALEDQFWRGFAAAIGLDDKHADDRIDPNATRAAVARIIAGRTAAEWQPILAQADCCATIVQSLEEAMHDPHFKARGLFGWSIAGSGGASIPALPVPIDPTFREPRGSARKAPDLPD